MLSSGKIGAIAKVYPASAYCKAHITPVSFKNQYGVLRWLESISEGGVRCEGVPNSLSSASRLRSGKDGSTQAVQKNKYNAGASIQNSPATKICILGGGFGGLYTVVRLQSLMWPQGNRPQVTLVDRGDRFVFKPLLYEIVNGSAKFEEVAPPYVKLLAPYTVNFVQGSVDSIEPSEVSNGRSFSGGKIILSDGSALEYDWLVLSLGSGTSALGVPGVKEYGVLFNTIQDAVQVRRNVEVLEQFSGNEVVVVGSGPAGVELATTVADRLGSKARVHLVSTGPEILRGAPSTHRAAAEKALQRRNVIVIPNSRVTHVKQGSQLGPAGLPRRLVEVKSQAGNTRDLESDLVLWTAGSQPTSKVEPSMKLPFPVNEKGALKTEDTLRVVGHPHVFALGDLASAAVSGQELSSIPATAQVAFQQADYAAWNIWAAIHNRPLLPFKYQHLGDMMSLGKSDGAVTLPIPVPRELSSALQSGPIGSMLQIAGIRLGSAGDKGVTLEGPLGALIRRAAYWYRQPTTEHRLEVGSSWLQQAIEETRQSFQGPKSR